MINKALYRSALALATPPVAGGLSGLLPLAFQPPAQISESAGNGTVFCWLTGKEGAWLAFMLELVFKVDAPVQA